MEISETGKLSADELAFIQRRLREDRGATGNADYRWDINISEGMLAEAMAERLFHGDATVEVKSDYLVHRNGRVAIEFRFRGEPSGISKTEATYYMVWFAGKHYYHEVAVLLTTDRLKEITRDYIKRHNRGETGPENVPYVMKGGQHSEFALVPKEALMRI
jgi:hypothetical protein